MIGFGPLFVGGSGLRVWSCNSIPCRSIWLTRSNRSDDALAFHYSVDSIDAGYRNLLHLATGPVDLKLIDLPSVPDPEVSALIIGGHEAATTENILALGHTPSSKAEGCTDSIARTCSTANQFEFDPMMRVVSHVAQQGRCAVEVIYNYIDLSIVEQITECRAAFTGYNGQARTLHCRHQIEVLAAAIVEEQRPCR